MPLTDPHRRESWEDKQARKHEEEDGEEEDHADRMLKRAGCLEKHYEVQECMADHKDWRKCQDKVKAFKECIEADLRKRKGQC